MWKKVLVANRGEIAVRVIRACQELGLKTVAIYSQADANSLHVALADESVGLPGFKPVDTYLNLPLIIQAAKEKGVQAIHPGYGYLSENDIFAGTCNQAGLVFIGPTPANIKLAGHKLQAREKAIQAGIPVVPGCGGLDSLSAAVAMAEQLVYPVMLKAGLGGGGRGMRVCFNQAQLREEFAIARAEAKGAFGDPTLYMEKYLPNPRHIEVQILGDQYGRVIHLGERECSIQRRYQKLIEECPAPSLDVALRGKITTAALNLAQSINYFNAGTVEFLLDSDNNYYFMEINARLQVEHPVTEMVTGVDLVKEQIRLALGEKLTYGSDDLVFRGWAIECRINAEDPERSFLPSPGVIENYLPPGGFGVRLDTHIYQGYQIPAYYDSLLAKLVAYGPSRSAAISTMQRALKEFMIAPVKTTMALHQQILSDTSFRQGRYNTGTINKFVALQEDD